MCEGECIGIFGLTGAGKSTLLRLLASVEKPDSGTLFPPNLQVGFSPQSPMPEGELTVFEYLMLYSVLYGIPRAKRRSVIREALALMGSEVQRNRRIKTLSVGETKLVDIARTLMCPYNILFFDEPMAGLDWSSRARLWEHLLHLRMSQKKTIVIAISRPEDADLCDRLILIHHGRVKATGTPESLRTGIGAEALVVTPIKGIGMAQSQGIGLVEKNEEGIFSVEVDPEVHPVELLSLIKGSTAAIRLQPMGLDSILEELVARESEKEMGR